MSGMRGSVVVLLVVASACAFSALRLYHWWTSPLPVETPGGAVVVRPGDTVGDVARRMQDAGLLDHPNRLRWATEISGLAGSLKVGEYTVEPGDTPRRLMSRIGAGEVIAYRFRIAEGDRIGAVLADLGAHPKVVGTLAGVAPEMLLTVLGVDAEAGTSHGEGWFFPDTYRFVAGDEDRDLLMWAHLKMREELGAAWANRAAELPYRNPYEALIAASIVEKETARQADRADVSQVIAARLRMGMRLQMDPTVIYGLGEAFDGNLTRVHLRQATAYNTYVHKGLPPTPIGIPGRDSLRAAVHPSGAPWLYFVSRGDGTSEFSRTLEEHQAAVVRYQSKAN